MLPAHERHENDLFLQQAIIKVIQDHVKEKKWVKGRIRRWAYDVGFQKFSEIPEFEDLFNYFKTNIADVLANEG